MKTSFVVLVGVIAWVGFAGLLVLQLTGWRGFFLPKAAEVVLWANFVGITIAMAVACLRRASK
jgi:hypothetical protein